MTTYRVLTRFGISLSPVRPVTRRGAAVPWGHVSTASGAAEEPQSPLIAQERTLTAASCSYSSLGERPANRHLVATPVTPLCRSLHATSAGQPRFYSSRRGRLSSIEDAHKFLAELPVPQRMCLEKAVIEAKKEVEPEVVSPPTWNQLKLCTCVREVLCVL